MTKTTYTAAEFKSMEKGKGAARARTPATSQKEKKALSPKEQMDLSQEEQQLALAAVTINSNAEYVTYDDAEVGKPKELFHYFRLKVNGHLYRIKVERVD